MECFGCKEKTKDKDADKHICGSCRKVLKVDLVYAVLELDQIILSDQNRNKHGKKSKYTADQKHDIKQRYLDRHENHETAVAIMEDMKIKKTTFYNIIKNRLI